MRLTAVLPNHNHAGFLPRMLGCLVAQTRQPNEIIVIDDESTDGSVEVIRGFMSRLPQLILLQNPKNLGVVGALNRGLEAATGDAILFCAADDAIDPDLIEEVLGALECHPAAGLACAELRVVDEDGTFLGLRPANLPVTRKQYVSPAETADILRRQDNWILSVVTIMRRDRIMALGGLDPSLESFCDSFLERRIALENGFVFVPRVLGTWNVRQASYSRGLAVNVERIGAMIAVARGRLKAAEGAPYPRGYDALFERRARFSSARLAILAPEFDPDLVAALAGGDGLDRAILGMAGMLPRSLRRGAALGWLTIRLRPTSLTGLVRTMVIRKLRGTNDANPGGQPGSR